jgi:uncharacterized protein YndB with AHSA1/START domain
VPAVTRARTLGTPREEVWRVVTDPHRLPGWWPGVERVEDAGAGAFTGVFVSRSGRRVRADYSVVEVEAPRRLVWQQEIDGSPFERILSESLLHMALEEVGEGSTRVALTARRRARGLARLGVLQMRLATARQLEAALDGLADLVGAAEG